MRRYFSKPDLLIAFLLILGAIFRFGYLTWGAPYFFHPDENNIASAITQMSLTQWNPHFFAYGGLPIYVAFFFSFISGFGHIDFPSAVYSLRFISGLLSLLLIPSLLLIGTGVFNKQIGITAAALATFSVGFIQFAHFGTFEMWLSFFTLWFFYSCFLLYKKMSWQHTLLVGILGGILFSIKISTLVFLPLPVVIFFVHHMHKTQKISKEILSLSIYLGLVVIIFAITNPFFFLDTTSYLNSLSYESSVALGTLQVFYTQSFLHTTPILYQLRYVYPFLLNPIVFFAILCGFIGFIFLLFKKKGGGAILLFSFFLLAFLSQATVFVKWTRYMVPTLPFLYLILAFSLNHLAEAKQRYILIAFLSLVSFIWSCAFFFTVYPTDTRIAANTYAKKYLPHGLAIVEPYDLGAIAFNQTFPKSQIINVYDLDNDPQVFKKLKQALTASKIFLSPSQRLMHTRLANPTDFPLGNQFYQGLLDGTLPYKMAYQTPCNFWCTLVYMGNPKNSVEDTASVFDHPIVTIFQHD